MNNECDSVTVFVRCVCRQEKSCEKCSAQNVKTENQCSTIFPECEGFLKPPLQTFDVQFTGTEPFSSIILFRRRRQGNGGRPLLCKVDWRDRDGEKVKHNQLII